MSGSPPNAPIPPGEATDPSDRHGKKAFYSDLQVVAGYDDYRFRSAGGRYVDRCEQEWMAAQLRSLPRNARILDMPVGTGRLSKTLLEQGFTHLCGADFSPAMLDATARRCGPGVVLSRRDAFATGWPDSHFDAVVSLRFTFHHPDIKALLVELARLPRPGGLLVFDTTRWTPRSRFAWLWRRFGGLLWSHGEKQVGALLADLGYTVVKRERCFLLPSFAYCFLPAPLLPLVRLAERWLPTALRTKTFWAARREKNDRPTKKTVMLVRQASIM